MKGRTGPKKAEATWNPVRKNGKKENDFFDVCSSFMHMGIIVRDIRTVVKSFAGRQSYIGEKQLEDSMKLILGNSEYFEIERKL